MNRSPPQQSLAIARRVPREPVSREEISPLSFTELESLSSSNVRNNFYSYKDHHTCKPHKLLRICQSGVCIFLLHNLRRTGAFSPRTYQDTSTRLALTTKFRCSDAHIHGHTSIWCIEVCVGCTFWARNLSVSVETWIWDARGDFDGCWSGMF